MIDLSLQFDFTLSYLDDFICDSLEGETKPYIHKNLRMSPLKGGWLLLVYYAIFNK